MPDIETAETTIRTSWEVSPRTLEAARKRFKDSQINIRDAVEMGIHLVCALEDEALRKAYIRLIEFRLDRRKAARIAFSDILGSPEELPAGTGD